MTLAVRRWRSRQRVARSATKRVIAAYAVILVILLGLLWFSLQQKGSPVEETSGVVEAVTFTAGASADQPGSQTAIVGYQQFFSAARNYEIVLGGK